MNSNTVVFKWRKVTGHKLIKTGPRKLGEVTTTVYCRVNWTLCICKILIMRFVYLISSISCTRYYQINAYNSVLPSKRSQMLTHVVNHPNFSKQHLITNLCTIKIEVSYPRIFSLSLSLVIYCYNFTYTLRCGFDNLWQVNWIMRAK